MVKSQ